MGKWIVEESIMRRREFLKKCTVLAAAGIAGAATAKPLMAQCVSDGVSAPAEKQKARKLVINPNKLVDAANHYFMKENFACSDAVFVSGCEALGIDSPLIRQLALGLGGGVGLQGETCGVITGAAMIISLAVAQREADYFKRKTPTMVSITHFYNAFVKQFAHTDCRTLTGADFRLAATNLEVREKLVGIKTRICANVVKQGARLLASELQGI